MCFMKMKIIVKVFVYGTLGRTPCAAFGQRCIWLYMILGSTVQKLQSWGTGQQTTWSNNLSVATDDFTGFLRYSGRKYGPTVCMKDLTLICS